MLMRAVPRRFAPLIWRYGVVLLAVLLFVLLIRQPFVYHQTDLVNRQESTEEQAEAPALGPAEAAEAIRQENAQKPHKVYKKEVSERYAPIEDPFPWLTQNNRPPPIEERNLPPDPHVHETTPLLIGFTRNWPMLLQCVCSYIAAGWPANDIYVVDNTGTFRANKEGELSLQNPFFLNHTQLKILGVHILTTPTLLTFSQLQNYYLHTALQKGWELFFWSHMDVIVFSDQEIRKKDRDHDHAEDPYATIYERAVGLMRYIQNPDIPSWGVHFFDYDQLALVNRDALLDVGGWDTHIPFEASDCDMYLRLHWAGYWQPTSEAGLIFDVGDHFDDVGALFQLPGSHATFARDAALKAMDPHRVGLEVEERQERDLWPWVEKEGETWQHLVQVAGRMQAAKWVGDGAWRSTWQTRQAGGEGEPFHQDPQGFTDGMQIMIDAGRSVFADKWGHRGCDLLDLGIEGKDAWRLERDWDVRESPGSEGGNWGKEWMLV